MPRFRKRFGIRGTARRFGLSPATVHDALMTNPYPRAASRRRYVALADQPNGDHR